MKIGRLFKFLEIGKVGRLGVRGTKLVSQKSLYNLKNLTEYKIGNLFLIFDENKNEREKIC